MLDSRLLYTNNRSRWTHLRHTPDENVMVLAKGNWSRTVNVDTFTPDGAFIDNTRVSVGETDFEGDHGWSVGFAIGSDGALTGYIDDRQRVHLRIIDQRGAFASLDRVASEALTGATSIWLAHGKHGYGALVEADADEGGSALYFLAVGEDGIAAPHPRRLTLPGVDVLTQRPQLLWDTDAWVAAWVDSRGRIQYARGRFDCQ